jgi:small subunit ribosomal protein S20
MRQNTKKRAENRTKKSSIRTSEKKIRKFAAENKIEDAKIALKSFFSLIDRASKTNLVHKNAASRKKSRLTQLLKKGESTAAAPENKPEPAVPTE